MSNLAHVSITLGVSSVLMSRPTPGDYYSLGDIVANGHSLDGKIINVLAAVRSVS